MTRIVLIVPGWLLATVTSLMALRSRRLQAGRMEAIARACHELRGPLTAARLGLQLGERDGELSPSRLGAIDLELGRAALALEDLAGVPAGKSGTRRQELVDVGALLSASIEARRTSAAVWGVVLEGRWSGCAAKVWGDRTRLAQALGNLISNAIEHGGGVVEVRGRLMNGHVRIDVLDGGVGLRAPVAELTREAKAGLGQRGRGLAIASSIAEAHGGRLAAAPSERGARLVLELPAARTAPVRAPVSG